MQADPALLSLETALGCTLSCSGFCRRDKVVIMFTVPNARSFLDMRCARTFLNHAGCTCILAVICFNVHRRCSSEP